jgi:DNA (cytosine-5)-methyltransferase 1
MANPHAWNLTDLKDVQPNGISVMSTFACGGGSSMGYKRLGCEILAANDIDPEMEYHYKLNLKPKHYFLCPIKDLITAGLPPELFSLDILDGSPPCSSFSMAGNREKDWGKKKHFREGQAEQVLDDLFFDYLNLVDRLKPKVSIAENVKGMIQGAAKGYVKMIFQRYKEIGYRPQLFLVNAADCGVPQKRERVFFVALRNDIEKAPLDVETSA